VTDKAAILPGGVQQIWARSCRGPTAATTCHQAVNYKGFEQAEHPYRRIRSNRLKTHPLEDYAAHVPRRPGLGHRHGAAHGEVAHWEEPLLSRTLGEEYTLAGNKNALMQMNCNTCHRYDRETRAPMPSNLAKRLVNEKGLPRPVT